jgi:hypothetical protein
MTTPTFDFSTQRAELEDELEAAVAVLVRSCAMRWPGSANPHRFFN